METKRCSKCDRELPIECFGKNKSTKDGFQHWCKECRKQFSIEHRDKLCAKYKEYYNKNKDKYKQYALEHKEDKAEYMRQWTSNNYEMLRKRWKEYRETHKEERANNWRKWYSSIEGYCKQLLKTYIKADKKRERIGDEPIKEYVTEDFIKWAIQQPCTYCKKEKPFNEMGVDRIDNSLPHTIDNCVPCCTKCNITRGNRYTYEEFKNIKKQSICRNDINIMAQGER